jgi:hypothetical protein
MTNATFINRQVNPAQRANRTVVVATAPAFIMVNAQPKHDDKSSALSKGIILKV